MVLFWSARAQRGATACLAGRKRRIPDQVQDDGLGSPHLSLKFEQMIFAVEPGLADGAFGHQSFSRGAALGLEDDEIASAAAVLVAKDPGGADRHIGLLKKAADL